jgi:transposase
MSMMTTRRRRSFSPEFKAQTFELGRTSGKSVAEVCRDLDLTETAVRRWVAQAEIDAGRRDGLTNVEREELSQLRKEVRVLRQERDILAKATAFLRQRDDPVSRYWFIAAEKANYPVALLCRVLQVASSGYYAWRHCPWPCEGTRWWPDGSRRRLPCMGVTGGQVEVHALR